MKNILCLLGFIFISLISYCQTEINIDSAARHEAEIVKVCTKIYGGKYLASSKTHPTFLDAGASYPHQKLTILIWGDKRSNFKNPPETFYTNKNVCIIGKITMYKDKPEIIINSEDQITIQ